MPPTLQKDVQTDFSAGAYPLFARDEIPPNAVEDAVNCLLSDDGLLYRRGGGVYKGNAPGPVIGALAANPGHWLADVQLLAGPRTIAEAKTSGFGTRAYVLDPSDDTSVVDMSPGSSYNAIGVGNKPAFFKNLLILPGQWIWGGWLIQASNPIPATGTMALTNGSTTVVGTGTSFSTSVSAKGMILSTPNTDPALAVVDHVTDATHLELSEPWDGATVSGIAAGGSALKGFFDPPPAGLQALTGMGVMATVGTRLFAALGQGPGTMLNPPPANRVFQTDRGRPRRAPSTNYWDLPPGATVLGIEGFRDTAVVFSSLGVYAIYNTAQELTDPAGNVQQRLEELSRDLILWSWAGVASYQGRLIVPALDGIYLFSPAAAPVKISEGIGALYRSYVDAGYAAGMAAVYRGEYTLPIIQQNGAWVDTLVCRLQPTRRGHAFGWTRFAGHGGAIAAAAVRSRSGQASLLGLNVATARIETLNYRTPTVATDADSSAHVATIVTREFRLMNGVKNFLARLRMRYELSGTGATVSAQQAADGAAPSAVSTTAPVGDLSTPKTWTMRKRGFGVRVVLSTAGSATGFILHSLEAFIRPSGRA